MKTTKTLLSAASIGAVALSLALPSAAYAQDTWTGGTSSDWTDGTNWQDGTAPTSTGGATINTTAPNPAVINGTAANASNIIVGSDAPATLQIINGGTLISDLFASYIGYDSGSNGTVTLSGAGSAWTGSNEIFVGTFGTATGRLNILSGGTASTNHLTLGLDPQASGTVTVNGAGSNLSALWIHIGREGSGTLDILNGATVTSSLSDLGELAGSNASVHLTGAGSYWNAGTLRIGMAGTASVYVTSGAHLNSNQGATIGVSAGSSGTVIVDGPGSLWTVGSTLRVGGSGNGTLYVTNGGVVDVGPATFAEMRIGANGGGTGRVVVDGVGSLLRVTTEDLYLHQGSIEITNGGVMDVTRALLDGSTSVVGAGSALNTGSMLIVGHQGAGTLDIREGGTANGFFVTIGSGSFHDGTVNVDGLGSSLVADDTLVVAQNSTNATSGVVGRLNVTNGGSVVSERGYVGTGLDSNGQVRIDGVGSNWTMTDNLSVGYDGYGFLNLVHGGTVNNSIGTLGVNAGSIGSALISHAGSHWNNSDALYVGYSGQGVLAVGQGGLVTSTAGFVGFNAGSTGFVQVYDPGSRWTVGGPLSIGGSGSGELRILNGARVENAAGNIGVDAGGEGTVTVDGVGSTWANSGFLWVGRSGTGTLNITNGGLVSNTVGIVAADIGSTGMITVNGAGSRWDSSSDMIVGSRGTGTLALLNGGRARGSNVYIGDGESAVGTAVAFGSGSNLSADFDLVVGGLGEGAMALLAGGSANSRSGFVGLDVGSFGTVTISGAGSNWAVTNDLTVGRSGTGQLNVLGGGAATSANGYVGAEAGSSGAVTIRGAGSNWTMPGDLFVGYNGHGELTIEQGGLVSNYDGAIGTNAGSSGAVVVTGANSRWTNNDLFLGLFSGSSGTLEVSDGGVVTTGNGYIANRSDTTASVRVTGAGSRLEASDTLIAGNSGNGQLEVLAGGVVTSLNGSVGHFDGSTSTARINGAGSAWNVGSTFDIGRYGNGTVLVDDGGMITTSQFRLGNDATGSGQLLIDGAGSNLQASGNSTIGGLGDGTVTVRNGGTFNTGGTLRIADAAGSTGRLIIGADYNQDSTAAGFVNAGAIQFGAGNGEIVFNHSGTAYTFAGSISGQGNLSFLNGTTILTGNSSGFHGQASLQGGTLVVNGSFGDVLSTDSGTRLMGTGTIGIATIGGIVAPGNSIGTLNFGSVTLRPGSTYEAEITTTGLSDRIAAIGNVTINGGTVRVMNPVGTYALGTRYTIITAGGTISGTFSGVSVLNPLPTPFLTFGLSYAPKAVYLDVLRSNVTFASVGQSDNQKATGAGLDSLPQSGTLINALVQLTGPQAAQAFDQLSGEVHASAKTAMVEDSRFVRGAMGERMRGEMGEGAYLWGQGYGSWGHTDSDGNAARSGRSIGGALIGYDRSAGENVRLGLLAGWSRSQFDVAARNSAGHAGSVHLGLYGNGRWEMGKGELALRAGGAYSWHKLETARQATFPGFADSLSADYNAGSVQGFAELGYTMKAGKLVFEPYAGLAFISLRSNGFTEAGGAAALTGHERTDSFTFSSLGLRTTVALGESGTFRLGTGWRHAFGDAAPLSIHSFGSASQFAVAGSPVAGDQAEVEAGLDFAAGRGVRIGASYGGQFGKGASDHSVRATISVKF